MFTQPAPAPSGAPFPPPPRSSTAPTSGRGSRLRGLIHLRSHTSRDSGIPQYNNNNNNTLPSPHPISPTSPAVANESDTSTTPRQARRTSLARPITLVTDIPSSISEEVGAGNSAVPPVPSLPTAVTTGSVNQTASPQDRNPASNHPADESAPSATSPRAETAADRVETAGQTGTEPSMTRPRSSTTGDMSPDMLPSVRFSAFYDARSNRPSLSFTPLSRTLPTGKEIIRVGRYSERENHAQVPANTPSAHPVGFKSKVVSRRHCEFWYEQSKWYIKDVKSSSGTFLNHIRLSAPGTESKPFPINDGDIVQLGIDFKGGEEMIYRCVKMRVELNRGWQAKPNTFNMATHQRLRNLTGEAASSNAQDCSICLSRISPCQSLFVAPCSHTWHYKCIRELLTGPSYPIFMCPNCRAVADLDAEVEDATDEWQQLDSQIESQQESNEEARADQPAESSPQVAAQNENQSSSAEATNGNASDNNSVSEPEVGDATMHIDSETLEQEISSRQATAPVPIPNSTPRATNAQLTPLRARRTPSPNDESLAHVTEGPITPRNDAGPWVFDGDPERVSVEISRRNGVMTSLDAAAQGEGSRS